MAGILNKKLRFIDYVVTQEGKRQLASGKMRVEYASVTDMHTFYDKSEHDNVSERLFFEVMERPENVIVMEKDDSGKLIDFNFSPTGSIVGNDIFDKDAEITNVLSLKAATGSQFASTSESLIKASLKHFSAQKMVGTNFSNGANKFEINQKNLKYTIRNAIPFEQLPHNEVINVNDAEPFFFDSKLSHFKNFRYLPPLNTDGSPYGNHNNLNSATRETYEDIKRRLGEIAFQDDDMASDIHSNRQSKSGDYEELSTGDQSQVNLNDIKKEFHTINFLNTSFDNNLLMQMFEDSHGSKLTKLDIVDAGSFYDEQAKAGRNEKRVFYVGKVYFDDNNVPTFINMFTLVLD